MRRTMNLTQQEWFRSGGTNCHFIPLCRTGERRRLIEKEGMKFRPIVAAALITAFTMPAFAAGEFYVVQDVKTKKCTIVDSKPTDTSTTIVSPSGTVYKTRTEAEAGMKSVKVCTTN